MLELELGLVLGFVLAQSGFEVWSESHSAKRGVIFQRTVLVVSIFRTRRVYSIFTAMKFDIVPAPVVPLARDEERSVGDCWIVYSRLWMVRSMDEAFASTKPRFEEGMSWEKRRKDSILL